MVTKTDPAYINFLTKVVTKFGLDPNQQIDVNDPMTKLTMAIAITTAEQGRDNYSYDQYVKGIAKGIGIDPGTLDKELNPTQLGIENNSGTSGFVSPASTAVSTGGGSITSVNVSGYISAGTALGPLPTITLPNSISSAISSITTPISNAIQTVKDTIFGASTTPVVNAAKTAATTNSFNPSANGFTAQVINANGTTAYTNPKTGDTLIKQADGSFTDASGAVVNTTGIIPAGTTITGSTYDALYKNLPFQGAEYKVTDPYFVSSDGTGAYREITGNNGLVYYQNIQTGTIYDSADNEIATVAPAISPSGGPLSDIQTIALPVSTNATPITISSDFAPTAATVGLPINSTVTTIKDTNNNTLGYTFTASDNTIRSVDLSGKVVAGTDLTAASIGNAGQVPIPVTGSFFTINSNGGLIQQSAPTSAETFIPASTTSLDATKPDVGQVAVPMSNVPLIPGSATIVPTGSFTQAATPLDLSTYETQAASNPNAPTYQQYLLDFQTTPSAPAVTITPSGFVTDTSVQTTSQQATQSTQAATLVPIYDPAGSGSVIGYEQVTATISPAAPSNVNSPPIAVDTSYGPQNTQTNFGNTVAPGFPQFNQAGQVIGYYNNQNVPIPVNVQQAQPLPDGVSYVPSSQVDANGQSVGYDVVNTNTNNYNNLSYPTNGLDFTGTSQVNGAAVLPQITPNGSMIESLDQSGPGSISQPFIGSAGYSDQSVNQFSISANTSSNNTTSAGSSSPSVDTANSTDSSVAGSSNPSSPGGAAAAGSSGAGGGGGGC